MGIMAPQYLVSSFSGPRWFFFASVAAANPLSSCYPDPARLAAHGLHLVKLRVQALLQAIIHHQAFFSSPDS